VPLGTLGMIVTLLTTAFVLNSTAALIACLIGVGFFTGFYIVPLFTLLQHRAPKKSKGDLLASSNFINVIGAITASLLFKGLVMAAGWAGVTPKVMPEVVGRGVLVDMGTDEHGRPNALTILLDNDQWKTYESRQERHPADEEPFDRVIVETVGNVAEEERVVVGRYKMRRQGHEVLYYRAQPEDTPFDYVHDQEPLTSYLFLGAALLTLLTLILLCVQLPDFFVRMLICFRSWGRYRLRVHGVENVPTDGAVLLATNCDRFDKALLVWSATDRYTPFVLIEEDPANDPRPPLLHFLARCSGLTEVPAGHTDGQAWNQALRQAVRGLARGRALAVTANGDDAFWMRLHNDAPTPIVPVYCDDPAAGRRSLRVVIGPALASGASLEDVRAQIAALDEERTKDKGQRTKD
jgi:hypothetical protein